MFKVPSVTSPLGRTLLATGAFAALMLPTGCATAPPTVPEIKDAFNDEQRRLIEIRDEWLARCKEMSGQAQKQCEADAWAFYNTAINKIQDARLKAIQENWEDARKAREAYEEWLRKQLDNLNIPGIIRDLIKPLLPLAAISADVSGSITNITKSNGHDDGELHLSGTFSISSNAAFLNEPGTITARFNLAGALDTTTPTGAIYSGMADVTTASGASWTGVVETDKYNELVTDASGAATLTVTMKSNVSVKGWGSVLPVYPRLQLFLKRDSDGVFRIQGTAQPSSSYFNRDLYAITDYDRNGSRVFATDYAAFSAGLAAHQAAADVNEDGAWDSQDSDLWLRLFAEDTP